MLLCCVSNFIVVIMPNAIILGVARLNVIKVSVLMLNVVVLSVLV